jgi:hypothetical protein
MLLAIFAVAAIAGLAWLLFAFAVYAMPLTLGVYAAVYTYHTGAGVVGAAIIGVIVAGLVLGLGEFAFSRLRPPFARVLLALAFAVPAAIAGYWATHGIVKYLMPAAGWQIAFSVVGAATTGFIAMVRLANAPHVPIDASLGLSPLDNGYGSPTGLASAPRRLETSSGWARNSDRRRWWR